MCSGGDDSLYGVMDWLQENIENILQSHNIHQISTAARGRSYQVCSLQCRCCSSMDGAGAVLDAMGIAAGVPATLCQSAMQF